MSYGVKYRIEYKDSAGIDKRLDIEERDYAGARTDCLACEDPLNIDIPGFRVFTPIASTGATVNVESATNMMFVGLYTADPQKIRLRCFAGAASVPYWVGYGNTEVYGEPYSLLTNYDVSLYFNDGFSTLARYKYLNGVNKYDTLERMWNVLVRIITKMGLPFEYLLFACRHSHSGISIITGETLWHNLKIDQLNYYDENDKPMTYQQVIEALLIPFGLQIRWFNGSILISEPQMLFDANFSVKRYNSSFAYVDIVNLAENFNISSGGVDWEEPGLLDKLGGYSKQKIRYSPYLPDLLLLNTDITNRYKWTGSAGWIVDALGVYRMSGITAITGYVMETGTSLTGHKRTPTDSEEDIYFEKAMVRNVTPGLMLSTTEAFNAGSMYGQLMEITGKIYLYSAHYGEYDTFPKQFVDKIYVPCTIEVDGKGPYLDGNGVWRWENGYTINTGAMIDLEPAEVTLCDRWLSWKCWVPPLMPGGKVKLKIWGSRMWQGAAVLTQFVNENGKIRYKELAINVYTASTTYAGGYLLKVTNTKELTGDDVSYEGTLNEEFINEADEITLLHSDGVNMTDRGAIRKLDGSFTGAWQKGSGISYRLPDILLRMIISQYKESRTKLNGRLDAHKLMTSNGGPAFLFTIQDGDYLGAAKLMFMGGTYNDFYRTIEGDFEEIKEDNIGVAIL